MIPKHLDKKITYIVGGNKLPSGRLVPFAPVLCDFLNDISSELRSNKENTNYPDIMTFAFWCRKANLKKLKENFLDGITRLGRGLAFHITPSNVPINFAFSFAFGLLAGNSNVVRIPSKSLASEIFNPWSGLNPGSSVTGLFSPTQSICRSVPVPG